MWLYHCSVVLYIIEILFFTKWKTLTLFGINPGWGEGAWLDGNILIHYKWKMESSSLMLWQQSNSDREFLHLDTKSAIIRGILLKLRLSVHLLIFLLLLSLYPFLICCTLISESVMTNLHIFFSVSFLPVSGCLITLLLLQMLLPLSKS